MEHNISEWSPRDLPFAIPGYNLGDNISLLNVIYHKPVKDSEGKYGADSIDIIFKDLDTGEKQVYHQKKAKYVYFLGDKNKYPTNVMFAPMDDVQPFKCNYVDLKKDIAELIDKKDVFIDNIKSGNYRANDELLQTPYIFNADMNIEDFYRCWFDRMYRNEPFTPTKLYFDIEVDGIELHGAFPQPGQCPVNAITLVDDYNKKVYTLLLENYNNPLIEEFKQTKGIIKELKKFVRDAVGGWKQEHRFGLHLFDYKIVFFANEIELIKTAFDIINTIKPDFALAWNIAFDLPYLIQRIINLGYDPRSIICHPDFEVKDCWYYVDSNADKFEERGDAAHISCYSVYLDQLITFASRRKGQRALASFKLDYIGNKIAKVRKLDYSHITTRIDKLPYLDYHTFVFYNIMDTIVQLCVEHKVSDVDFVYAKSMSTNTRYPKVHRQTTYLINRGIKEFWDMGYVMGSNINKSNPKVGFAGAFVADPLNVSDKPKMKINGAPVMVCDTCDDFDYKALYPSIIDENNMAPNTQRGKILINDRLDPKENRFNNSYFDRSVWFIEDLVSHDRLTFCSRYLHLADYVEMYHDILNYFSTVKNPHRGLQNVDYVTGRRIMVIPVIKNQLREMCTIVDNTKPRTMVTVVDKMPNNPNGATDNE